MTRMPRLFPIFLGGSGAVGILVLRFVAGTAMMFRGWPKIQQATSWVGPDARVPGVLQNTATLLTDVMGFRPDGGEGNRFRYRAPAGDFAAVVDLLCVPGGRHGVMGAGVVHHVAFRTPDDEQQRAWRATIVRLGFNVSPVMDRTYFHSIYFREPGGVLFEVATDNPGFTADEAAEELGTRLMLPPWLEPECPRLEKILPRLRPPGWHTAARPA